MIFSFSLKSIRITAMLMIILYLRLQPTLITDIEYLTNESQKTIDWLKLNQMMFNLKSFKPCLFKLKTRNKLHRNCAVTLSWVARSYNTQIYNLNSGPHITHFSEVAAKKRKIFEYMFVLKRANIACRQQMTKVNLLQKHFKQLSYYAASNW